MKNLVYFDKSIYLLKIKIFSWAPHFQYKHNQIIFFVSGLIISKYLVEQLMHDSKIVCFFSKLKESGVEPHSTFLIRDISGAI